MTTLALFLWLLNISVDTGGHLVFKMAASQGRDLPPLAHWRHMALRPWLWAGILCYVFEFFIWMAFLSQVPLSTGVMLGSINTVAVMVAGRVLFQERLTRWRTAGIGLITLGVALVGLGGV